MDNKMSHDEIEAEAMVAEAQENAKLTKGVLLKTDLR